MEEIKPYILEKSKTNGFDFYRYLYIKGGSGNWRNKPEKFLDGGEYDYCIFYALPEEMEGIGSCCERIWCKQKKIPFGTGATIEEAYENYLSKTKREKISSPIE